MKNAYRKVEQESALKHWFSSNYTSPLKFNSYYMHQILRI